MRLFALLLCTFALATAADSAAITAFRAAMGGDDAYAKRDAIRALADSSDKDDDVLPLLVQAVGDRQGADPAVQALRRRTGLTPPSGRGGSAFPGYPNSDSASDWQTWLTARNRDAALNKKLEKLEAKPPVGPAAEAPAETAPAQAATPPPRIPTDDLGKPDRIVYKSGRSLIAFVRSKRLDGDGNLVSVRIVHRDGAGEEVIDAATIARIEEDVE